MNDFDFEELDKAVNNLANKTHDEHGGPDPTATSKTVPTVPAMARVNSEPKPEPTPEPAPVTPISAATEAPAVKSPSAPAKHRLGDTRTRRGSFMDIVPPAPRKAATRVGVSVQPVSKAEEIVPETPAPTPTPAKIEPEEPALPDLNDLKLDLDTEPKMPEPAVTPKPEERAEPKPTEPQSPPAEAEGDKKPSSEVSWPDPLDFDDAKPTEPVSPFLAEAKVEKRPLGAFSNFKPAEAPKPVESPKSEPEATTPEVQDELTPEADGTFEEPKKEKAPLPPKESEKVEDKEPAKPDVHGAAMMAIPDQYRPEPKQTDKTTRPVYDTKEYHPPLIEATSHEHRGGGSMWGKIFVAFVALALIAVGGYFTYIYLVQQ